MADSNAIKVIAFDPGTSTGWATGYILDGQPVVTASGYGPWKDVALRYTKTMRNPTTCIPVVVYESFRLRKNEALKLAGSDFPVVQMIGIIKNEAWNAPKMVTLVTQEPSDKPTIDQMMGGTKNYLPPPASENGKSVEHERDALRHLWYYFVTQGGVDLAQIGRKD